MHICGTCVFVFTHAVGRVKTVAHMFSFWEMKNGEHGLPPLFLPFTVFQMFWTLKVVLMLACNLKYVDLGLWRDEIDMEKWRRWDWAVKLLPEKTQNNPYAQNLRHHCHFSMRNKTDSWMARSNKACHPNTHLATWVANVCPATHTELAFLQIENKAELANKISLQPLAFVFFTTGHEWSGSKQRDH